MSSRRGRPSRNVERRLLFFWAAIGLTFFACLFRSIALKSDALLAPAFFIAMSVLLGAL